MKRGYWACLLTVLLLLLSVSVAEATETNVALNKPAHASSSWNSTPGQAFDGDKSVGNGWNSGNYAPAWIYVDLQQNYDLSQIRLTVDQTPDGNTTHNIYTSQDAINWTLVKTLSGYTSCFQTLTVDFIPPLSNVRYVKIETVSSPSWVAWFEIEVYAVDNTTPPVPTGYNTYWLLITAISLMIGGWHLLLRVKKRLA